jgi:hypothetical protein
MTWDPYEASGSRIYRLVMVFIGDHDTLGLEHVVLSEER